MILHSFFPPDQQTEAVRRGLQLDSRNEILRLESGLVDVRPFVQIVWYHRRYGFDFDTWWKM